MGSWPPGSTLLWYLEHGNLLASDLPQVSAPIKAGIESWNHVCGVSIAQTFDAAEAQLVVRFVADLGDDPGAGSVNAQAWIGGDELGLTDEPTPGAAVPLVMRLNPRTTEGWTALTLDEVAIHESGHFLGFDHAPDGELSCMSALLDTRVHFQTQYDIAVAQSVYGPPQTGAVAQATYGAPSSPPPAPAITPAQSAAVPPLAPEPHTMGVLTAILAKSVGPFLAELLAKAIHEQLQQGSPLNAALAHVIQNLETHVPANMQADANELLTALLALVEGQLDHAVTAAAPAA